ncbi:hypothetical protein Ancab_014864 [Ancistrocladus abbreviatus]
MPISFDLADPQNLINKIVRYEKVAKTILDEILPISIEMAKRNLTGIWNFTIPGIVNYEEILEMYKKYIDPNSTWKNFTLEEQANVFIAPRSNNGLDTTELKQEFWKRLPLRSL